MNAFHRSVGGDRNGRTAMTWMADDCTLMSDEWVDAKECL